jgi:hypothetical protein
VKAPCRSAHGAAFFVKARQPVGGSEGLAEEELARPAVQHVEDTVAIAPQHDFARLSFPLDIGEHGDLRGIVIHLVMRRELVKPFQLARVGIQREHAIGIQVVAEAAVAVGIGIGIAGAPISEVQVGIVGAGVPDGSAAGLPGVAGPGFVAGLPGSGDTVEAPDLLPGFDVEGGEEIAHAGVAAGGADDDFILDHQRRVGDDVTFGCGWLGDLRVPDDLAGFGVDGEQMRIKGAHEEGVAEDGESAVNPAATRVAVSGVGIGQSPEDAAGNRVERVDVVGGLDGVENAVDNQCGGLELFGGLGLPDPLEIEVLDVGGSDLVEQAVALAAIRGPGAAEFDSPASQSLRRAVRASPGGRPSPR